MTEFNKDRFYTFNDKIDKFVTDITESEQKKFNSVFHYQVEDSATINQLTAANFFADARKIVTFQLGDIIVVRSDDGSKKAELFCSALSDTSITFSEVSEF